MKGNVKDIVKNAPWGAIGQVALLGGFSLISGYMEVNKRRQIADEMSKIVAKEVKKEIKNMTFYPPEKV